MNGCGGHCCAAFWMPFPSRNVVRASNGHDAEQIAGMLIPLSNRQARVKLKERGVDINKPRNFPGSRGHYYTCKNWNPENGLCMAYDSRPHMCSAFPYGNLCPYGCSCEDSYESCSESKEEVVKSE